MAADITLRSFKADDYDAVVQLWRESPGVEIAEGDDRETILSYLRRNPDLSRIAEAKGRIVGAVLCGHDGRRGLIYHLAVAPELRGQHIGRRLITACLEGLREQGIKRALVLVVRDNQGARRFWEAHRFEEISGAVPYGVDIP